MTRWPEVELGQICEFKYGKSLPASSRSRTGSPVYGSNGIVGYHDHTVTEGPTVIIGRKGSYGEVAYSNVACWPIDTTYYVDSSATDADLKWLSYRISGLGLTEMNTAAAVPGLNRENAYRAKLLLPPLAEQRRIAAILDKAGSIRTKRRQVLDHLDALTQSIFHHMFDGVPATATVEQIAARSKNSIRTGPFGSQLLHSEFTSEGISVLGLDNVVSNYFHKGGGRFITPEKYSKLRRYTVYPGDVLISIMGTVGRCVVVPNDIPTAINTKHICAITIDDETMDPEFLRAAFLWHPDSRQHLQRQTKGSIMAGLNMSIIKMMPIPVPPLHVQRRFTARLRAITSQYLVVSGAASRDDELFASLQSKAFKGEL